MVYKQRFQNPNYKTTAAENYAHIRYIATRPRVAKNEGMSHGLFGKLAPGSLQEFSDWRDIARLVYQNARQHITMYRSVVSFDETTAGELHLTSQKAWQRYIEKHILTIAQKNGIRVDNLQWACALHKEKKHPHVHVVFWDRSSRIKNPFTPPAVPDAIRRQMIKDTFAERIRIWGEQKNVAAELRQLGDELVDEFEQHIRQLEAKQYRHLRKKYDAEEEISNSLTFENQILKETADRIFKIKSALPAQGRITYQLLPAIVKKKVDALVHYLLKGVPALQEQKNAYIQSKMKMAALYGGSKEQLAAMKIKFGAEADKIIANRILGMVKTLNRLDAEQRAAEYHRGRRLFYMEQMIMDCLSMLSDLVDDTENRFPDGSLKLGGDLSKEARKELYLKNQDKGYEH